MFPPLRERMSSNPHHMNRCWHLVVSCNTAWSSLSFLHHLRFRHCASSGGGDSRCCRFECAPPVCRPHAAASTASNIPARPERYSLRRKVRHSSLQLPALFATSKPNARSTWLSSAFAFIWINRSSATGCLPKTDLARFAGSSPTSCSRLKKYATLF